MSRLAREDCFRWPKVYGCVALTALGMLLLELALTRIFSVVFYYHFAFLAISIALFGLGIGGISSYVVAGWKGSLFTRLAWLSTGGSFAVILAVAAVLLQREELTTARLLSVYLAASLPFVCGGAVLSLAVSATIERVDRVYFFDLLGAACACLLLVPLLDRLGGPNTTLVPAILFAAAAALWHDLAGSRRGRTACLLLGLLLAGFLVVNQRHAILDVKVAKGTRLQDELFVRWNSFSRVSVRREKAWDNPAVFIDADASTSIPKLDMDRLSAADRMLVLRTHGEGLPYVLRPGAKTLIIGPGGGWDIAYALLSGSTDVTGVEINPIIATTIMREKFARESGYLYLRPGVRVFVEDGRSFIRRSSEKYQVVQATLVDTWASTAAGAFALSENNLYTTEAFGDYLSHLTGDGVMAFTRWGFEPPRESLRLVSLAIEALKRMGESDPARHFIVARFGTPEQLRSGVYDTVLVSRKPFSGEDVRRARASLAEGGLQPLYLPGAAIPNHFTELLLAPDPRQYQRNYPYDITPVGDNRPFFFYTVQPRDVWAFLQHASQNAVDFKINRAVPLLFGLMGVSLLATFLILALPPVFLGSRLPREKGVLPFLLYFVSIGVGYILVEVALIQKFVLFLGHPTYALTVVLFSMLVSSSLGSYLSKRCLPPAVTLLVLPALIALLSFGLDSLLPAGVGWPFWSKVVVTVMLIFPAGFLMGMPFPRGLRRLEERHSASVRWAWSLNAASSVLGSVSAVFCAIYLGLTQTLLAGAFCYAAALLVERTAGRNFARPEIQRAQQVSAA